MNEGQAARPAACKLPWRSRSRISGAWLLRLVALAAARLVAAIHTPHWFSSMCCTQRLTVCYGLRFSFGHIRVLSLYSLA